MEKENTREDGWTPYRKFKDADERIGAMKCGACRKPSEWVSNSTVIAGRVVLCDPCHRKFEK